MGPLTLGVRKVRSRLSRCVSEGFPTFRLNYNPFHFHLASRYLSKAPKSRSAELPVEGRNIVPTDCSRPIGINKFICSEGDPPSPLPSLDRLSVTFADDSLKSDSSKCNLFNPPVKMDKVHFPEGTGKSTFYPKKPEKKQNNLNRSSHER